VPGFAGCAPWRAPNHHAFVLFHLSFVQHQVSSDEGPTHRRHRTEAGSRQNAGAAWPAASSSMRLPQHAFNTMPSSSVPPPSLQHAIAAACFHSSWAGWLVQPARGAERQLLLQVLGSCIRQSALQHFWIFLVAPSLLHHRQRKNEAGAGSRLRTCTRLPCQECGLSPVSVPCPQPAGCKMGAAQRAMKAALVLAGCCWLVAAAAGSPLPQADVSGTQKLRWSLRLDALHALT